jgi:chemotaxis protein CheX
LQDTKTLAVLPPIIERILLAPRRPTPQAAHFQPFLQAACEVLELELGMAVRRGTIRVEQANSTVDAVSVLVAIRGRLTGLALFGMCRETALAIAGQLLGETVEELDEMVLSGIAELGNVITGRSVTLLTESGLQATVAPPILLVGAGSRLTDAPIARIVVPLEFELGSLEAHLAMRDTAA